MGFLSIYLVGIIVVFFVCSLLFNEIDKTIGKSKFGVNLICLFSVAWPFCLLLVFFVFVGKMIVDFIKLLFEAGLFIHNLNNNNKEK